MFRKSTLFLFLSLLLLSTIIILIKLLILPKYFPSPLQNLPPPPKATTTTSQKEKEEGKGQLFPSLLTINTTYQSLPLRIYLRKIPEKKELVLIPNFTKKQNGEKLAKKNHCNLAINGGFYTKEEKPLGLFSIQGGIYAEEIKSNLVNGFLWQDAKGVNYISRDSPQKINLSFILQTGPLFSLPQEKPAKIIEDKPARRSIVAMDNTDNLYFLILFNPEDIFSGPNLSYLPAILSQNQIQKVAKLTISLNLDGGSASFFFTKQGDVEVILSELAPIGSLLCVK